MSKHRTIMIEVELDDESGITNTGFDAGSLEKWVRSYVFKEGEPKEWRLEEHLVSIRVAAMTHEVVKHSDEVADSGSLRSAEPVDS
jgi:hypothetical protein